MSKLKSESKTGLKYFDMKDLRSYNPCFDPNKYLEESFKGTAIDILNNENIPSHDRLWVALRTDIVSEKLMRLFAVWCAREALLLVTPDPRGVAACGVAERFAEGNATKEELDAAGDAAWAAAWAPAGYAAKAAAKAAARAAAGDAAEDVALDVAGYAAEAATGDAQIAHLKKMIVAEGLERVKARSKQ